MRACLEWFDAEVRDSGSGEVCRRTGPAIENTLGRSRYNAFKVHGSNACHTTKCHLNIVVRDDSVHWCNKRGSGPISNHSVVVLSRTRPRASC